MGSQVDGRFIYIYINTLRIMGSEVIDGFEIQENAAKKQSHTPL